MPYCMHDRIVDCIEYISTHFIQEKRNHFDDIFLLLLLFCCVAFFRVFSFISLSLVWFEWCARGLNTFYRENSTDRNRTKHSIQSSQVRETREYIAQHSVTHVVSVLSSNPIFVVHIKNSLHSCARSSTLPATISNNYFFFIYLIFSIATHFYYWLKFCKFCVSMNFN